MSTALPSTSLPLLPSFRRQQLLLEFASLKHYCPDSIYLTSNPTDPTLWTGVYFVREGPYSSAVLRFELLFPPSYPEAPPLLIFSTEIFHPLLVPLTTYTFTPGAIDPTATYSASESERLPPGALSLKYGFPNWYRIAERGRSGVKIETGRKEEVVQTDTEDQDKSNLTASADTNKSVTIRLLEYVKSVFEDPQVLDELPLEAAGNVNAWHAWRSHRGLPKQQGRAESPPTTNSTRGGGPPRNPADWNWDGVWEARVRDGVDESTSDALLFGSKSSRGVSSASDQIRFIKYGDSKLADIQDDMLRMHGFPSKASDHAA